MNIKKNYILLLYFIFQSVLLLWSNIKMIKFNCFNAIDFSIYQQAIYNIAAGISLNPYLTVRNIHIFNDHFDPIILVAALWIKVVGYSATSLIVFEWLWLIILIVIAILVLKNEPIQNSLFAIFAILSTKALLTGIIFPIHPSTWAMVPIFLLIFYLSRNNELGVIVTACVLMLFRESFAFAVLPMSFFFLWKKRIRTFLWLFIISLLFVLFELKFRRELLGITVGYGDNFVHNIVYSPLKTLLEAFINFNYIGFIKIVYPFIIPIAIIVKNEIKNKKTDSFLIPVFLFVVPLLLLHFLANKFHFQYGAQFGAVFLGIIVFSKYKQIFLERRKLVFFILFLFFLSSMGIYSKYIKITFFDRSKRCVMTKEKYLETQKVKRYLTRFNAKNILSTGGVIPVILKPNMLIYHLGGFSKKLDKYDFLLLELNNSGDTFPVSQDKINRIKLNCSVFASNVFLDTKFYYLAHGSFPHHCLE